MDSYYLTGCLTLLVVMELIVCKCNRMCKGTECQWFSNALMYESVNYDNLIHGDFEDSGDEY